MSNRGQGRRKTLQINERDWKALESARTFVLSRHARKRQRSPRGLPYRAIHCHLLKAQKAVESRAKRRQIRERGILKGRESRGKLRHAGSCNQMSNKWLRVPRSSSPEETATVTTRTGGQKARVSNWPARAQDHVNPQYKVKQTQPRMRRFCVREGGI